MVNNSKSLSLLDALLDKTFAAGGEAADAVLFETAELHVTCRKGVREGVERSESAGVGLRAWVGARQAIVSSTDTSAEALEELAARAVAMARLATEDADSRPAPEALLARDIPSLDLHGGAEPPLEALLAEAQAAEAAALGVAGVTNTEGAEASYSASTLSLMTRGASGGFAGSYRTSLSSLSVSALAGEGTGMERDYDYTTARHREDLLAPEAVGRAAGERAVKRLSPRRVPTCEAPVIFEPRVGKGLLAQFAGAINGSAVARGTSFLKDSLGKPVFAPGVRIVDDPHRRRGLASRPFDGEGVRCARLALVEDGELASWLLDTRSASKLGLSSTGHAARGLASPPSPAPSNLYMEAGAVPAKELFAGIKSGFYVTETFGMGVNLVTGDYSQGAAGFWIENGEIAYPVAELTIAGHLREMLASLTPADDLEFRYGINTPHFRIARMTVAGA